MRPPGRRRLPWPGVKVCLPREGSWLPPKGRLGAGRLGAWSGVAAGLDLRTGRQVFSFPDGEFTPVITDGKVVFLIGYSTIHQMLPRR